MLPEATLANVWMICYMYIQEYAVLMLHEIAKKTNKKY